jgi:hypothetical protein
VRRLQKLKSHYSYGTYFIIRNKKMTHIGVFPCTKVMTGVNKAEDTVSGFA